MGRGDFETSLEKNVSDFLNTDVPEDERSEIEKVCSRGFFDRPLEEIDAILWDAYPWLSVAGFKFVLRHVVDGTKKSGNLDGLVVDAILDECSGGSQASSDPRTWTDPFGPRWQALSKSDLVQIARWLNWVLTRVDDPDDAHRIRKCKNTLEWLRGTRSSTIVL